MVWRIGRCLVQLPVWQAELLPDGRDVVQKPGEDCDVSVYCSRGDADRGKAV